MLELLTANPGICKGDFSRIRDKRADVKKKLSSKG